MKQNKCFAGLYSPGSPQSQAILWSGPSSGPASRRHRSNPDSVVLMEETNTSSSPSSSPCRPRVFFFLCLLVFLSLFLAFFLAAAVTGWMGLVVSGPTWLMESSRLAQVTSLAEISVPRDSNPCQQEYVVTKKMNT